MTGKLNDRVAIVTGAGRGIGRGVALALAEAGATVVASGRNLEPVQETVALIESAGGTAMATICDVTSEQHINDLAATAVERFGTIDILINNAQGETALGMLLDVASETFLSAFTSGPLASFRLMNACHPFLVEGGGVIVNFGTGAGIRPDPIGYGCYAAVKEATRALSRGAAVEWGRLGIRVHSVVPLAGSEGLTWWAENRPEEAKAFFDTIPLGRVGDPQHDIGRAVVFLCSDESSYITGNTIAVDGGQAYLH